MKRTILTIMTAVAFTVASAVASMAAKIERATTPGGIEFWHVRDDTLPMLEGLRREYPDARLMLYLKRGLALANEMKWLGSYRYAVVNMAARSGDELQQRFAALRRQLFPDSDLVA